MFPTQLTMLTYAHFQITIYVDEKHEAKKGCFRDHKRSNQIVFERMEGKATQTFDLRWSKRKSMKKRASHVGMRHLKGRTKSTEVFFNLSSNKAEDDTKYFIGIGPTSEDVCDSFKEMFLPIKDQVQIAWLIKVVETVWCA
eukprot:m.109361 g.109361  ORF g.109361 m.109361 type:complete len:141 (-) comp9201_c1_seq16:3566-3988(-)